MIYETLEILKDQINHFLELKLGIANLVVLDNIAKIDDTSNSAMNDKVVISLLNINEEITLKNQPLQKQTNESIKFLSAPLNVNMYVLISANRSGYEQAIATLSFILEFFQAKQLFTNSNTPLNPSITALDGIKDFKFKAELFATTFEQLNYIWGTLGGKSIPATLYKISVIKVKKEGIIKKGSPILQVEGDLKHKPL